MNRLWHGALAAALIAAAMLGSRLGAGGDGISASAAMLPRDAGQESERFRLSSGDSSCILTKSVAAGDEPAKLSAGDGCDEIMPGLSTIRFWREAPDGSVLLSDREGAALAAFAVADGAGYESFEPRRPLMSLIEYE